MVQQKLFSFNIIERDHQEISPRSGGIEALNKSQEEISKRLLKMDKTEAYTMYVDPTIIDLGYKSEAQMTYTGVKGDRPILVGLKEFAIFVHADYRQGNAMGGILKAVESAYEVVESAGKRIKHFSGDSECYIADLFNFLRQKGTPFTIVADQDVAVQETIRDIPYENKTIKTLRWKLIQVPARIIKTGRYIILKMETVVEKFNHYLAMIRRIEAISALIV